MEYKSKKHLLYRILLIQLILICTLCCACSSKQVTLLSFPSTSNSSTLATESLDMTSLYRSERFAKNLCIIPKDYKQTMDATLTAEAVLKVDITDNKVLYADNIYDKLYPASITKLATALVVLKNGNLEDEVTVGYNATNITEPGAKKCGLQKGDKIKMDVLLTSFLVYSGNDAGVAIAEHIAGSEAAFSDMMNEEAHKIGAVNSHFVNSHGLHDDKHYTTAYDIYLILNELQKYEKFLEIIHTSSYKAVYQDAENNEITKVFETTNRFLRGTQSAPKDITVIGGKTGTTNKAGSCLTLLSKDNKEHEYITVILHAENGNSLFAQMAHLLE